MKSGAVCPQARRNVNLSICLKYKISWIRRSFVPSLSSPPSFTDPCQFVLFNSYHSACLYHQISYHTFILLVIVYSLLMFLLLLLLQLLLLLLYCNCRCYCCCCCYCFCYCSCSCSSFSCSSCYSCFFFNDTATTEIYTLSLHDALPIYHQI